MQEYFNNEHSAVLQGYKCAFPIGEYARSLRLSEHDIMSPLDILYVDESSSLVIILTTRFRLHRSERSIRVPCASWIGESVPQAKGVEICGGEV